MYQFIKTLILIGVAPLFLGITGAQAADEMNTTVEDSVLTGEYSRDCQASELSPLSVIIKYQFNEDGTFTETKDLYLSADCSEEVILGTIALSGNFKIDGDEEPVVEEGPTVQDEPLVEGEEEVAANTKEEVTEEVEAEGKGIQFDLQMAVISITSEELAAAMNEVQFCGASDYAAGTDKELSEIVEGSFCTISALPGTLYGVHLVEEDSLYLNEGGLSQMGRTAEDRPMELDRENPFRRVEAAPEPKSPSEPEEPLT